MHAWHRTSAAFALAIASAALAEPAGAASLRPLSVVLPHGSLAAGKPCEAAPGADRLARAAARYAASLGLCAGGGDGAREAVAGETLGYLPTRALPGGTWVTERDAPRLAREAPAAVRGRAFLPAGALATVGPAAIRVGPGDGAEADGPVIETDGPAGVRWFESATGWVADPERMPSPEGAAMLATCYGETGGCFVTMPVCEGVGLELVATGVSDPGDVAGPLAREYRAAREALSDCAPAAGTEVSAGTATGSAMRVPQ